MNLWQRYFLKEWFKIFFIFIVCFYGLYVIIDYANHTGTFHHHQIRLSWVSILLYYIMEFFKRLEIILPFAILIATIRTLVQLNVHRELVALLAGGISNQKLLTPFLLLGLAGSVCMYLNYEYLLPSAHHYLKPAPSLIHAEESASHKYPHTRQLALEDGTMLLFNRYNSVKTVFVDAYWVRSIDEVYHMEFLNPHLFPPEAYKVELYRRSPNGKLLAAEFWDHRMMTEMEFNPKGLLQTITPPDEDSLSILKEQVQEASAPLSEKDAKIATIYYRKLVLPWLCLLAVIGTAPFCMHFCRNLHVFFIYAGSIFGLVAIYLSMNAATVLGERQVVDPLWAIATPFLLFSTVLGVNYFSYGRL